MAGVKYKRFMDKTIGQIIDEISVVNIKIYMLVDRVQKNEHTLEDAKRIQDLNKYRAELMNAINKEFKQQQIIKL
jgi:hypothetical protein